MGYLGGQNKCWTLYTMLVGIANSPVFNIGKITIRYFTVGNSFMSADNFHRMVAQEMKAMDKVYDFTDFVKGVSNVGESIIMSHTDFYQYESGLSESKLSKSTRPYLADVSDVQFRRGSLCLHYKLRISTNNNEFLEADILMSKAKKVIGDKPKSQKCEQGITSKKKDGILKLKECIPKNRLAFCQNLAVNEDVVDLLTEREKGE